MSTAHCLYRERFTVCTPSQLGPFDTSDIGLGVLFLVSGPAATANKPDVLLSVYLSTHWGPIYSALIHASPCFCFDFAPLEWAHIGCGPILIYPSVFCCLYKPTWNAGSFLYPQHHLLSHHQPQHQLIAFPSYSSPHIPRSHLGKTPHTNHPVPHRHLHSYLAVGFPFPARHAFLGPQTNHQPQIITCHYFFTQPLCTT